MTSLLNALKDALTVKSIPNVTSISIETLGDLEKIAIQLTSGEIFYVGEEKLQVLLDAGLEPERAVQQRADDIVAALHRAVAGQSQTPTRILPIVRPLSFVEEAKRNLGVDLKAAELATPITPELFICYAADFPDRIEGVYQVTDGHPYYPAAWKALRTAWEEKPPTHHQIVPGDVLRLRLDGNFDTSLMFLRSVWEYAGRHYSVSAAQLICAVPAKDVMLFAPEKTYEAEMLSLVERIKAQGVSIVSEHVFHQADLESHLI